MAFGIGRSKSHREQLPDLPDEWVGWLEAGVEFEGKMKVPAGLIRLNARFKGEIASEGAVVVHDQAEVVGNIQAKVVSITGKVKGTLHATERLEIKEHGIVLGDIYTPCLLVDPGAFFDGQCHMPAPEAIAQASSSMEPNENGKIPILRIQYANSAEKENSNPKPLVPNPESLTRSPE
jgi:cytoskeletal protein CcmA (bactofilin family)